MSYPDLTPPSSPWAMRVPDVPGQRDPEEMPSQLYGEGEQTMVITTGQVPAPEEAGRVPEQQPVPETDHGDLPGPLDEDRAEEDPEDLAEMAPDDDPVDGEGPEAREEPEVVPHRPGEVPPSPISLWSAEGAASYHSRFAAVLPLFVDDPAAALTQATAIVNEAVDELAASLRTQHAALDPRNATSAPDTESLRIALCEYRDFLDRILAL